MADEEQDWEDESWDWVEKEKETDDETEEDGVAHEGEAQQQVGSCMSVHLEYQM